MFVYFFFSSRRRHTRYIGDWSSDVCSSDLVVDRVERRDIRVVEPVIDDQLRAAPVQRPQVRVDGVKRRPYLVQREQQRSEERRVGKESRDRWWKGEKKTRARETSGIMRAAK